MYTFKKIRIESADELLYLWPETFMQAYYDLHSPENLQAYCTKNYSKAEATAVLSSDQFSCIIAYRESLPVGYYILKYQPCPTPLSDESAELKQIYILSSEYGKGLGKLLFEHSVNTAQQANHQWIWLCVSNSNYRAQKFYNKLNFESIAPGPILEVGTDKLSSTIMALNISSF